MGGGTMRTAAWAVAGYRSGGAFYGHASSATTAGWKEKDALESTNPAPSVVFGSVPTIEEAKEATSDLQVALGKVSRRHGKGTLESEAISEPMPRHVVQAFSLLQGSTEAQNVVASLTADRNVWDAVMKNDKVMEFYRNHQLLTNAASSVDSVAVNAFRMGSTTFADPSADTSLSSVIADFVNNIKKNMMELVGNVSSFFQDFFGNLAGDHSGTQSSTRNSSTSDSRFEAAAVGASFLALVVASILIVLVKRG